MALAFHTEDPDRAGDALNIFLFPELSPLVGLEAALLTRKWDTILGGGTLTSFSDTSMMMGKKKVAPITGCDNAASQLETLDVFCTVFLGDDNVHPATYKMFLLLEDTSGIIRRLMEQARYQPTFPAALLCLIHQDFNEIFCQALERRQRVRWTNLFSNPTPISTSTPYVAINHPFLTSIPQDLGKLANSLDSRAREVEFFKHAHKCADPHIWRKS